MSNIPKNSLGGFGLEPEEDEKLRIILRRKDRAAKQVVRELLRTYIDAHKHLTKWV